ncbi:MAG: hypothetical protein NTX45_23975 [Proteobacteria bacterium]|nr:hypothetical protein [Pseudomonadota bacterium]
MTITFEDRTGYAPISERDKAFILCALLDNNNFMKHIEIIYLGKLITYEAVDYIHVQVFNDAGKNKRVYLVRVYAKAGQTFPRLDDLDIIPLRLENISIPKVIEKFKERILLQKEEIGVAKQGLMRPFLIKVWRDFTTLTDDQQLQYEPMIESTAKYITVAAHTLQNYGMYPHTGNLFLVDASGKGYQHKAWLETQGLIPGLSLSEKLEDFSSRFDLGIFTAEEYQERIRLLKIVAVSGYLQMWRILNGAYITDQTVRNILIEGTYEDGYFPAFFDIDRLTSPGKPLLEVLEKLRCSEIGNDPSILLSGYVSTFALKPEDSRTALEDLLEKIKSSRRAYPQLNESITAALNSPEAYYRTPSALHMCISAGHG